MTLRHFQFFICVCDTNSMTKAAQQLHISQPSISQTIKELESFYDVLLFERLGKKLFLTPAGHELLHYARHIISLTAQTETALRGFAIASPLRLGATLSIGESIFIDILSSLKKALPEQQIFSQINNTATLEACLLKDQLDMALVEGEIKSEYLTAIPFMSDELIFIAAPGRLPRLSCTGDELSLQPFILRERGSGTRTLFARTMEKHHLSFQTAGEYNSSESIKQAVSADMGISIISRRLVQRELAAGSLSTFAIPGLEFKRTFRLVHHRNKYISKNLRYFMELCLNWH